MYLVISPLIVLLASSGPVNQLPEPVSVNEQAITLDDLKAVNNDLNKVRRSLHGINPNSDLKDDPVKVKKVENKDIVVPLTLDNLKVVEDDFNEVRKSLDGIKLNPDVKDDPKDDYREVKKVEIKAIIVPLTLDDLKAVNDDLSEVRKSLDGIKSSSDPKDADLIDDPKDDYREVKKAESIPDIIPAVVVTKDKENIKPKQNIIDNKKVVLIEKRSVITLTPVNYDDETTRPIEKTDDEVISVVDIKPAYIKYGINGKLLQDNNEQWTCVFDTNTGLMWEVKSKEDAMRNSENLYTWYNPDKRALNNKSLRGVIDGGHCKGGTDCDTNAYVMAMNQRNFCGHNDWKLPTREQMQTLVDLKNGEDKVKINKQYFPQTVPSWYWTSSDEGNKEEFAWYVLFRNGFALSGLKERAKHIRLVRNNI